MQDNPSLPAAPPTTGPEDMARLRTEIKVVEGLLPRLVDRGAGLYLLAHHYAHLGDQAKALALLKECVALGEGFDPSEAHAFVPLKSDGQFRQLGEQVRREFPPVRRARVALTLAQSDLFPEGLAVDAAKRIFLMSSMHHNKIVRITESGEIKDFVKEGVYELMPVGGVVVRNNLVRFQNATSRSAAVEFLQICARKYLRKTRGDAHSEGVRCEVASASIHSSSV
jgi:hypothetical protein